jgi:hypothetical protein
MSDCSGFIVGARLRDGAASKRAEALLQREKTPSIEILRAGSFEQDHIDALLDEALLQFFGMSRRSLRKCRRTAASLPLAAGELPRGDETKNRSNHSWSRD